MDIHHHGPEKGYGIEAGMPVKMPVFELQNTLFKPEWDGVAYRKTPLAVGGNHGAKQLPVTRIDDG
jgi:hypothetical protein